MERRLAPELSAPCRSPRSCLQPFAATTTRRPSQPMCVGYRKRPEGMVVLRIGKPAQIGTAASFHGNLPCQYFSERRFTVSLAYPLVLLACPLPSHT